MSVDRQWLEQSLRASLEALALRGDLDNFYRAFVGNFRAELSAAHVHALRKVDSLLDEMSSEHNSALWTDDAVRAHPRWQQVRECAQAALRTLEWPVPPS